MHTYSEHAYTLLLFSRFFLQTPMLSDLSKLTPISPIWLIHGYIKHEWDGLNISLMASLTLKSLHHNLPFLASLAYFCPAPAFFILFKNYSRLLPSPKGHLGCAVEICWLSSIFEGGLSVFLIHWWHGSLHMKVQCGFQWTWGEHIYKLNPEPMELGGKYLLSNALKWREHHLRYYIIH